MSYNIKVGSKLLCKDNYYHKNFTVGKYYEITQIFEVNLFETILINNNLFSMQNIKDIFYSEQEERKIKMQIIELTSRY